MPREKPLPLWLLSLAHWHLCALLEFFARFLTKTQHSTEGCHEFIFRLFLTGITGNYLAQKNSSANPRNSSWSSGRGLQSREENFTFSEPALSAGACCFSTSSCLLRMNPTSAAGRMQWAHDVLLLAGPVLYGDSGSTFPASVPWVLLGSSL